jgi:hypothetical protein
VDWAAVAGMASASAGREALERAADSADPRYVRTADGDILLVKTGEYLRTAPRPGSPVRAWHGVLPGEKDRAELQTDAIQLLQDSHGVGNTFWIDFHAGNVARLQRSMAPTARVLFHRSVEVSGPFVAQGNLQRVARRCSGRAARWSASHWQSSSSTLAPTAPWMRIRPALILHIASVALSGGFRCAPLEGSRRSTCTSTQMKNTRTTREFTSLRG